MLMWCPAKNRWNDVLLHANYQSQCNTQGQSGCDAVAGCVQLDTLHAASWSPLLWGMPVDSSCHLEAIVQEMQSCGLVQQGGLATSLIDSGQQWDSTNCWPNNVCVWVDGLLRMGNEASTHLGLALARKFLSSVAEGLDRTGFVWEKYNSQTCGDVGCGGEYDAQIGFGWTLGTALHFLLDLQIDW
jgi:alpha,alpha-trehalase